MPAHPVLIACVLLLVVLASGSLEAQETPGNSTHQNPSQRPNPPQPSSPTSAVEGSERETEPGTVSGTVIDVNNDPVPGASVALEGPSTGHQIIVTTDENGFYEIHDVQPGVPYRVIVRATGFVEWTSPALVLKPGQYEILTESKLRLKQVETTIVVSPKTNEEIATEQVKVQEKQRGFGFIPNFFTVYQPNPVPLTPKLKFSLSFKVARDPFVLAGAAILAAAGQTAKNPYYGDGWEGFGERLGANYANQLTDIMIGGAILPSLLHQDPRYFYQGTGTIKSRIRHALSAAFAAKGDNGHWQPNYSSLGGDLSSAAISNAYYPSANRGVGLTFENFAINTAVHMGGRLLQEFVFRPSH